LSKVAITGNASGSGTFTLAAPDSNSDRTLTLPDVTGTIVTTGSSPSFPTTIGVGGATPSTSGAGITFPATESASSDANTLDDYEEGTWSPVIVTSAGTVTYGSRRFGGYRKIGSAVFVEINVNFTCSTGGAFIQSCSLPFTASYATASTFPAMAVGGFYNIDLSAGGTAVEAYTTNGSATCNFHASGDNIDQGNILTNSNTALTMEFRFSGIFFAS